MQVLGVCLQGFIGDFEDLIRLIQPGICIQQKLEALRTIVAGRVLLLPGAQQGEPLVEVLLFGGAIVEIVLSAVFPFLLGLGVERKQPYGSHHQNR